VALGKKRGSCTPRGACPNEGPRLRPAPIEGRRRHRRLEDRGSRLQSVASRANTAPSERRNVVAMSRGVSLRDRSSYAATRRVSRSCGRCGSPSRVAVIRSVKAPPVSLQPYRHSRQLRLARSVMSVIPHLYSCALCPLIILEPKSRIVHARGNGDRGSRTSRTSWTRSPAEM
jgi:hypothetical protein